MDDLQNEIGWWNGNYRASLAMKFVFTAVAHIRQEKKQKNKPKSNAQHYATCYSHIPWVSHIYQQELVLNPAISAFPRIPLHVEELLFSSAAALAALPLRSAKACRSLLLAWSSFRILCSWTSITCCLCSTALAISACSFFSSSSIVWSLHHREVKNKKLKKKTNRDKS